MHAMLLWAICAASPTTLTGPGPVAGFPSVVYNIDAQSKEIGSATLEAAGVSRQSLGNQPKTVAHLVVELRNPGEQPIALDLVGTKLDALAGKRRIDSITPKRVAGVLTAPGHATQRIDLYFALPPGVAPDALSALRLRWRVTTSQGNFNASTPFVRASSEASAFYFTPATDPLAVVSTGRLDVAVQRAPYQKTVRF